MAPTTPACSRPGLEPGVHSLALIRQVSVSRRHVPVAVGFPFPAGLSGPWGELCLSSDLRPPPLWLLKAASREVTLAFFLAAGRDMVGGGRCCRSSHCLDAPSMDPAQS